MTGIAAAPLRRYGACAILALLLAGLSAEAARAQDARLQDRLDAETATEVEEILSFARAEGLPTEPLIAKAIEGASKGAAGERIVAAVRAYAHALRDARDALGPGASDAETVAGAGVLLAGVDRDRLRGMREVQKGRSLTVPLVVLADLAARGVPPEAAAGAVVTGLREDASDPDFLMLRQQIENDIQAGAPPAAATELRARALWTGPSRRPGADAPGALPPSRPPEKPDGYP